MPSTNTGANIQHVGEQDFEERVLRSSRPVIVDFWAEWCPPCRALAPHYERLSQEYKGKLDFFKLNSDDHPAIPSRYGIMGIPTMIIFNAGQEIGRIVGFAPNQLKQSIDQALASVGIA